MRFITVDGGIYAGSTECIVNGDGDGFETGGAEFSLLDDRCCGSPSHEPSRRPPGVAMAAFTNEARLVARDGVIEL